MFSYKRFESINILSLGKQSKINNYFFFFFGYLLQLVCIQIYFNLSISVFFKLFYHFSNNFIFVFVLWHLKYVLLISIYLIFSWHWICIIFKFWVFKLNWKLFLIIFYTTWSIKNCLVTLIFFSFLLVIFWFSFGYLLLLFFLLRVFHI